MTEIVWIYQVDLSEVLCRLNMRENTFRQNLLPDFNKIWVLYLQRYQLTISYLHFENLPTEAHELWPFHSGVWKMKVCKETWWKRRTIKPKVLWFKQKSWKSGLINLVQNSSLQMDFNFPDKGIYRLLDYCFSVSFVKGAW